MLRSYILLIFSEYEQNCYNKYNFNNYIHISGEVRYFICLKDIVKVNYYTFVFDFCGGLQYRG